MHAAGIGHWVEPLPLDTGGPALPASGAEVAALQERLAHYGYGAPITGALDDGTKTVVAAFQRHFRPARVDGVPDPSTRLTLERLIAAL